MSEKKKQIEGKEKRTFKRHYIGLLLVFTKTTKERKKKRRSPKVYINLRCMKSTL